MTLGANSARPKACWASRIKGSDRCTSWNCPTRRQQNWSWISNTEISGQRARCRKSFQTMSRAVILTCCPSLPVRQIWRLLNGRWRGVGYTARFDPDSSFLHWKPSQNPWAADIPSVVCKCTGRGTLQSFDCEPSLTQHTFVGAAWLSRQRRACRQTGR